MFEKRPERAAGLERLWTALGKMVRGDVLKHEDAEAVLGIERGTAYYELINRTNKRMELERGVSLVNVPLVGYVLATPDEQLDFARRRNIRARRQIGRALRTVKSLPVEECDAIMARAKFGMEESLAAKERDLRSSALLAAQLMRPREPGIKIARDDEKGATHEAAC